MKFYWDSTGNGRPEKGQPLYCYAIYNECMEVSTDEDMKIDSSTVCEFVGTTGKIMVRYEEDDLGHVFYGYLNKQTGIIEEFLKD